MPGELPIFKVIWRVCRRFMDIFTGNTGSGMGSEGSAQVQSCICTEALPIWSHQMESRLHLVANCDRKLPISGMNIPILGIMHLLIAHPLINSSAGCVTHLLGIGAEVPMNWGGTARLFSMLS